MNGPKTQRSRGLGYPGISERQSDDPDDGVNRISHIHMFATPDQYGIEHIPGELPDDGGPDESILPPEGSQNGSGRAQGAEVDPAPGQPFKVPGEWRQYAINGKAQRLTIKPIGSSGKVRVWAGDDEAIAIDVRLFDKRTVADINNVADAYDAGDIKALLAFMFSDMRQTHDREEDVWVPGMADPLPLPDLDYYFIGLMEYGREFTVFGGFGAGKTWVVEGIVASLTHGVEVVPGFVPRHGALRVLYLDWDEGRDKAIARRAAVLTGKGLKENGNFMFRHVRGTLRDAFSVIAKDVAGFTPDVIVVSNRESAIGTGAEGGGDPGAGVMEAHHMLSEFGCGVIYIDHVTGDDLQSRGVDKPYGSVKKMNVDRGAAYVYQQSHEPNVIEVVLVTAKADSHEHRADDIGVRIEFARDGRSHGRYDRVTYGACEVKPRRAGRGNGSSGIGAAGAPTGARLSPRERELLGLIEDADRPLQDVADGMGIKPKSVEGMVTKLKDKQVIIVLLPNGELHLASRP